jgi:hypothetical protein
VSVSAEEGVEVPVLTAGVDMVVDSDEACTVVLYHLADLISPHAPAKPGEIFSENKVQGARFNQILCFGKFLTVEVLARSPARDDPPSHRPIIVLLDKATEKSLLVSEASLILMVCADTTDP